MKVKLICGFLGAGKTTLVKNLLRKYGKRTAVLVNDFGRAGIDGELIEQSGAVNVLELPSGCICCSLRADLDSALKQIYTQVKPERLIIEPTGIATPSAILETLNAHKFSEHFELEAVVGIVDPTNFFDFIGDYDTFFMDQILNSDIILVNKIDLAGSEMLEKTKEKIKELNPSALIYATKYCRVELPEQSRNREITHFHSDVDFDSVALHIDGEFDPAKLKKLFSEFTSGAYGRVVRAKGIFKTRRSFINLDYVPRTVESKEVSSAKGSRLVVIGSELKRERIEQDLRAALDNIPKFDRKI